MECEVKYKIADKKKILLKLKQLRAKDFGTKKETDIYLNLAGCGVRVRKLDRGGFVTIKRRIASKGQAKIREEIETAVEKVDNLIEIFKEAGFSEVKRKEKIRHSFKLGKTWVLVDQLPFMGYFVELEAASEAELKRTSRKLGFDYQQASGDSYDNLFFKFYLKNAKKYENSKVKIIPLFKNEREFLAEFKKNGLTSLHATAN